jgi:phage N-6-adenine-methyltransferase
VKIADEAGLRQKVLGVTSLTDLSVIPTSDAITAILARASSTLDAAKSSAEILEARDAASFAYDAAKSAARINRAKGAHDDLVQAAHRLQGAALRIDARAKVRLAEEIDAAQARGEIGKQGQRTDLIPDENKVPSLADAGLTAKDIFEARQVRDAERENPGIINDAIDGLLESGEEPTRAAVTRVVRAGGFLWSANFTGNVEWYTPEEHIERARRVMGGIDLDPATCAAAQARVGATTFFTEEDDGLMKEWTGRVWLNPPYSQPAIQQFVEKLVEEKSAGRVSEAILLVNNSTDTAWFQIAAGCADAVCWPKGRIRFVTPTGAQAGSPAMGQAFLYFGDKTGRFAREYSSTGFVTIPANQTDDLSPAEVAA